MLLVSILSNISTNKRQHKEELLKRGKQAVIETIYAHNYDLKDLTKIVTSLRQQSLNLS